MVEHHCLFRSTQVAPTHYEKHELKVDSSAPLLSRPTRGTCSQQLIQQAHLKRDLLYSWCCDRASATWHELLLRDAAQVRSCSGNPFPGRVKCYCDCYHKSPHVAILQDIAHIYRDAAITTSRGSVGDGMTVTKLLLQGLRKYI